MPSAKDPDAAGCDHHHTLTRDTLLQVAREDGQVEPAAAAALFALVDLGSALRRHFTAVLADGGLTEAKFCVLTVLLHLDPRTITAAELAYHAGVSRSALTDIIDQLVAQQWVERERSAEDRRTVRIGLRAAGRAEAKDAMVRVLRTTAELVRDCPDLVDGAMNRLCRTLGERCAAVARPACDP